MKSIHPFARLGAAYKDRAEPENLRAIAENSWRALVVCAVLLIIVSCAFGYRELQDVSQEIAHAQSQSPSTNGAELDRTMLESAMQALQARTIEFQSLAATSSALLADPYNN